MWVYNLLLPDENWKIVVEKRLLNRIWTESLLISGHLLDNRFAKYQIIKYIASYSYEYCYYWTVLLLEDIQFFITVDADDSAKIWFQSKADFSH